MAMLDLQVSASTKGAAPAATRHTHLHTGHTGTLDVASFAAALDEWLKKSFIPKATLGIPNKFGGHSKLTKDGFEDEEQVSEQGMEENRNLLERGLAEDESDADLKLHQYTKDEKDVEMTEAKLRTRGGVVGKDEIHVAGWSDRRKDGDNAAVSIMEIKGGGALGGSGKEHGDQHLHTVAEHKKHQNAK